MFLYNGFHLILMYLILAFFSLLPHPMLCLSTTYTESSCFYNHTSRGCYEYIARHRFLSANDSQSIFHKIKQLIYKGDIRIDKPNCQYNAIDLAVGCWALNKRLMPFLSGCDCAACGPAPKAEASRRVVEFFCSPPSKPPTIIQTVQVRTTEEWTTMPSLLMRDHHVSSFVPIWLHQGEHALPTTVSPLSAWPLALIIALSSALLFSLLVAVGLTLFVVVVRAWRSRPKYIVRRTYSVCSSLGGELPIEMRSALVSEEPPLQSECIIYRPTVDEVRLSSPPL